MKAWQVKLNLTFLSAGRQLLALHSRPFLHVRRNDKSGENKIAKICARTENRTAVAILNQNYDSNLANS
jgi:hypothetical protein